ncbi:hypothetical protein GW17_00032144 [Ensete ventricosum]|nr:hypothetical protein GW17_00032144 [Ensete ventricosum]RZS17305.1 hypothetical protein BHM03_00049444 [Ensete ventricosum]
MSIADQLTGVVGHHHPHAGVERVDDFLAMSPVRMEGKGREGFFAIAMIGDLEPRYSGPAMVADELTFFS